MLLGEHLYFTHFCFSETQKAKVNMFLLIDWWEIFNKLINSRYTSTLFRFNNLGIYNSENQRMKRLQSSQENAFIKWIHYIVSMLRFILRDELVSNQLFLSKFCSIFMINSIVWLSWWYNNNNNNESQIREMSIRQSLVVSKIDHWAVLQFECVLSWM